MKYLGASAIDYLVDQIHSQEDIAASSHWRKFHSSFRFTGDGFVGLQGFGGLAKPYLHRRILHGLFQSKFRRMAMSLPEFSVIDKSAKIISAKQHRVYDLDILRQSLSHSNR